MQGLVNGFVGRAFLRSHWDPEFRAFHNSDTEKALVGRLRNWSQRTDLRESSAEAAFMDVFFRDTWEYHQAGQQEASRPFTMYPQYRVAGAGQGGGRGAADLALGYFEPEDSDGVPQVLCEFKDMKSALDAPQKRKGRKGNTRSPVKQCLDYLQAARRGMFGNEPILPIWGIVTDMNEFRLYWFDRGHQQYMQFVIDQKDFIRQGPSLLRNGEAGSFDRFLFWKLFHRDTLLTTGGKPLLARMITRQWVVEREIENTFYEEYRQYRERLFDALIANNPGFPGTKGRLLRLAQKVLDRCIFIFFCEDMGQALSFPPQAFRDFLIHESKDEYFDPKARTIWDRLLNLFKTMNTGGTWARHSLNEFNGGLFADDAELEDLSIPNEVFCFPGQGQNEVSLYTHKLTLLYLSAAYNYAAGWSNEGSEARTFADEVEAIKQDPSKSLGLYMLGRIFEQSITELEIREAEADGRLSVNKESRRKRDGVYYTPEWIVERIVKETLGQRLEDLKVECGWPVDGLPMREQIDAYRERLTKVKIVDPACGSGAFLITSLRYLLNAWHELQDIHRDVTKRKLRSDGDDQGLIRDILRSNIYGVDINPASVEIARLALWLHTARGDKPLSSLEHTIRDGNSLIDDDFYRGQIDLDFYDADQRERVNTFNWKKVFPEVFQRGGFDVVIGNPPYVKLQNFRKVHTDMAEYLRDGREGTPRYRSTQTGNFDLYLPFIERGLELLNEDGRLGYIAPSLWVMNEYGEGLRSLIEDKRSLYGWIDFGSFQVFNEATTYTALQFYSKRPADSVKVAYSPTGVVVDEPWVNEKAALPYEAINFGGRWLLTTGDERRLIDRLLKRCKRLDNASHTSNIFVGIQTSADSIYHLKKLGPGRYLCTPKEKRGYPVVPPYEVELEDELMKPLVSGVDAKRYQKPAPDIHLLFPYENVNGRIELIDPLMMESQYPKAWKYLRAFPF